MTTSVTPVDLKPQMLALALASYQGVGLPHVLGTGESPAADLIARALATFEPLRGRWTLVWGPTSHASAGGFLDDALAFVARDQSTPPRYAVVLRGTNPVSVPDWIFGDMWVARDVPWPYGDDLAGERISSSTALGLSVIQSLRSSRVEGASGAAVPSAFEAAVAPMERSVSGFRRALESALEGDLTPPTASVERAAKLAEARASNVFQSALTELRAATTGDASAASPSLLGFFERDAKLLADAEGGKDLATFLGELTRAGAPPPEVWVTGHSKGAALATAVAQWLVDTLGQRDARWKTAVHCMTFAGPTVGNRAFAARVDRSLGERLRRVANRDDLVTHGWAIEGLEAATAIYGADPAMPGLFQKLLQTMIDEVRARDYQHVDPRAEVFAGRASPRHKDFFAEVTFQHLEAYIANAGLSLTREQLFG